MKKNRAFVTGGAGFLGTHLVNKLMDKNYDVVVFDIKDRCLREDVEYIRDDVKYVKGSVEDLEKVIESSKECDYIFHNAALADIDMASKMPVETTRVNVLGTLNCLEAARINKVKRFIFASSVYVSGNRGSFYRVSKQNGELLSKVYNKEFGVPYTIIRSSQVYGPDFEEGYSKVLKKVQSGTMRLFRHSY